MPNFIVLTVLLSLLFISVYSDAQEDETTILFYKFDAKFNDEVEDRSPHGNDGEITGNVKFEPEGKVGGAAQFSSGNQISVPISESLNVEENLTIEFWVKPDEVPPATYWRLIHKGWVGSGSYICGIDNNWMTLGYTWDINNMAGVRKDANKENAVVAETWQYYSATYDGEKIILYIDGEPLVETAAQGKINGAFDIIIAESFSGLMDEIRFSNAALEQEEIQAHMEGKDTYAVDTEGKVATTWAALKE
jgi:hypothetical protein